MLLLENRLELVDPSLRELVKAGFVARPLEMSTMSQHLSTPWSLLLVLAVFAPQFPNSLSPLPGVVLQIGLLLAWSGRYAWLSWLHRVHLTLEPVLLETSGRAVGNPWFEPFKGVMINVEYQEKIFPICVNPEWWHLLPGSAIPKDQRETVTTSVMSPVKVCAEPGSLICLENEAGLVIGMGSRVKTGTKSVLLTAFHVLQMSTSKVYIAKGGKRVELDRSWKMDCWNRDPELDFAAVIVPDKVWSSLGVASATARTMRGAQTVTCYGGKSSVQLYSSIGRAQIGKCAQIHHTASTTNGWSGTPLYQDGMVVGVHRSYEVIGKSNLATNFHFLIAETESLISDGKSIEIDEDEIRTRDNPIDYTIGGRGEFAFAESEFAKIRKNRAKTDEWAKANTNRLWSDVVDEDEDYVFYESMETFLTDSSPLNCQQAESACSLPQSELENTNGQIEPLLASQECHSIELATRVCVLEKLVEQLTLSVFKMQELISQNSVILAGLSADQLRNSIPSCSKPVATKPLTPPETLVKHAADSLPSIPELQSPVTSAAKKAGRKRKSRKRSQKSRTETSIKTPLLESPISN